MRQHPRQHKALRTYLHPHGSQSDLAQRLDISESLLSLIVAGKRPVKPKLARRIAKLTGIPIEALLPSEMDRTA
jgi:transcriptional regulator with XRE-family HTH domain